MVGWSWRGGVWQSERRHAPSMGVALSRIGARGRLSIQCTSVEPSRSAAGGTAGGGGAAGRMGGRVGGGAGGGAAGRAGGSGAGRGGGAAAHACPAAGGGCGASSGCCRGGGCCCGGGDGCSRSTSATYSLLTSRRRSCALKRACCRSVRARSTCGRVTRVDEGAGAVCGRRVCTGSQPPSDGGRGAPGRTSPRPVARWAAAACAAGPPLHRADSAAGCRRSGGRAHRRVWSTPRTQLLGALDDGQLLRQGMLLGLEVDAQVGPRSHWSCAGGRSSPLKVDGTALDQVASVCKLQPEEHLQCLSEGPLRPVLRGLRVAGVGGAAAGGLAATQQVASRLDDQAQQDHARPSACGHAKPEAD